MRFLPLFAALVATSFAASGAKKRLIDAEETLLSLDRSKEVLDSGKIALSLTRIDDLLDDQNDNQLLLERITHIALTIQLDVENGSLNVNGQTLPMLLPPGEGIAVTVVKAEAYSMPGDLPAAFYTPEHVDQLAESLSVGIASISVRLDSEVVPIDVVGAVNSEDQSVAAMPVEGVSYRKLGLFVTINEIEGKTFEHSRTVYAPILQLLVTAENVDGGEAVKQISTLSVGGQPVLAQGIHAPDYLPDVPSSLPPVGAADDAEPPRQLWSALPAPVSGIWSALESIFGQPRYEHSDDVVKTLPAFAAGARKGLALGPNAPQFDDGLYAEGPETSRPHHKHMHGHCFWKKAAKGFLFLFAAIHFAFTQTLPGVLLLTVFTGAIVFHTARRIKKRCQRQEEVLPQYEGDLTADEYRDEKPPTYSEPVPQTNLTIFDADAPEEKA